MAARSPMHSSLPATLPHGANRLARPDHARHPSRRSPAGNHQPPAATLKVSRNSGMAEGVHEVSHGDILYKLGSVEGKIDHLAGLVAQKQSDLTEAFKRISLLEQRVAQGVIIAVIVGALAPLAWQAMTPRLHFGQQAPLAVPSR